MPLSSVLWYDRTDAIWGYIAVRGAFLVDDWQENWKRALLLAGIFVLLHTESNDIHSVLLLQVGLSVKKSVGPALHAGFTLSDINPISITCPEKNYTIQQYRFQNWVCSKTKINLCCCNAITVRPILRYNVIIVLPHRQEHRRAESASCDTACPGHLLC